MTTTRGRGVLHRLLGVVWFVVPPLLVLHAFGATLTFLGEQPTDAAVRESAGLLAWAAVVVVGVPLIGLFLTAFDDRTGSGWRAALVVGLVVAAFCVVARHDSLRQLPPPPRPPAPTQCQEFSGGKNICPGA